MTPNTQALQRLLDAVEAGRVGQFRNLDSEFGHGNGIHAKRAYNGSLDAAKALHDALLPGWEYAIYSDSAEVSREEAVAGISVFYRHTADNDNPARAWLLAIIRAVMAGER